MQSGAGPRLAGRGGHGEQHHLRRTLIGRVVLERDRGRLARRRHDFDPLVDQHACERLRQIERRIRMHDKRELAGRHLARRVGRQTDPALTIDMRKLSDCKTQGRAGAGNLGRLQARTETRHRLAHALHLLEPRIHGERIAALQRRARSERFRELGRIGHREARQREKAVAEHGTQHVERRRRALRALDAALRFLRYRSGLGEQRFGGRRRQRRRAGDTEAAQHDDRVAHRRHVGRQRRVELGCERSCCRGERLLRGLRARIELDGVDARVERSLQADQIARIERPHAGEQLPRTHRELGQLIETDLRRQPGRVALTIDAQRFAGRKRTDLRCTGCERTRVDLGRRIARTGGREIHGVDRLDGKLGEAQIERLDHGAFGVEPLDREADVLEVAEQASGPRVERRLGERARRRR